MNAKMKQTVLTHEFVEYIPEVLQEATLYISIRFATAVHKCVCGCGSEVVTPLSPRDWKLIFDGETVSLDPSIGNWSFRWQSHYWIQRNRVVWARRWRKREIETARTDERMGYAEYFGITDSSSTERTEPTTRKGLGQKIRNWRNRGL